MCLTTVFTVQYMAVLVVWYLASMSLMPVYVINLIRAKFNVSVGKFCKGVCQNKFEQNGGLIIHSQVYSSKLFVLFQLP